MKLLLTGGGSAGHVTPNLAIIEAFQAKGWALAYIGSNAGIEKQLISRTGIPFYGIACGKLRRYFSWQNFIDPFKIIIGILQSVFLLVKQRPTIIFSKGGYVAVPVVVAAWLLRIPVICHESDLTPGLANRLCYPFARWVCLAFEKTAAFFKTPAKLKVTGTPIRVELKKGERQQALSLSHFSGDKPGLLVMGGGLGAMAINKVVREALPKLLQQFDVIHICGPGKTDEAISQAGYQQFEYLHDELAHVFAWADIVVSRAGANALLELVALAKPHLLIPLPTGVSRGDQLANSQYFKAQGLSQVLTEADLTPETLLQSVQSLWDNRQQLAERLTEYPFSDGTQAIVDLVMQEV